MSKTAARLVERLGASLVHTVADRIAAGDSAEVVAALGAPAAELAAAVSGLPRDVASAYLRGLADGFQRGADQQRVDVVWSGPSVHGVPSRATAQVLTELIGRARHEVLLVTYSAKPYQPVLGALAEALTRGVVVNVVVETLQGAGSALSGTEPAAAFAGLPAIKLWHWPKAVRPSAGSKMHAKIAVADRCELFVSSVNLTESGIAHSVEAGALVCGGTAPRRAAEHVDGLIAAHVLEPLS